MEELIDDTKRAILEQRIEQSRQQAFSQFIDIEFTAAQGMSGPEKKAAKNAANDLRNKRANLLKGITRMEEMLEDLPPAIEKDDEDG